MGFLDSIFGGGNKCPVCGMKVDEKTGIKKHGAVFCSQGCVEEYEKGSSSGKKGCSGCSCCGSSSSDSDGEAEGGCR